MQTLVITFVHHSVRKGGRIPRLAKNDILEGKIFDQIWIPNPYHPLNPQMEGVLYRFGRQEKICYGIIRTAIKAKYWGDRGLILDLQVQ